MTAFERLERKRCIVRRARLPPPREDADPCAGEGTHGCLRRFALLALLLIVHLGPESMPGGCRRPLDTRVAQERRTLETPVDPRLLPAAFRHRRHPRLLLECLSSRRACTLCATGHEEAWGTDRPGTWEGVKQRKGGMLRGTWRDGGIAGSKSVQGDAEWSHERVHQEGVGGDDAVIRGPRHRALDRRNTGRDDVSCAHGGRPEAALQGGAPCALCRGERR